MNALRPTEAKDLPEVSRFLVQRFGLDSTSVLADTKFLEWKYLAPRPGSDGSRSYVLEQHGSIAAHGGICLAILQLHPSESVRVLTIMDWAANPATPGIGVALFSELMGLADATFIIGGAPVTRQIIPRIGFRNVGDALTFSRWLRPFKEFRKRPWSRRSFLRIAHGLSHSPRPAPVAAWEARPVIQFESKLQSLLNQTDFGQADFDQPDFRFTRCRRTIADLNYLLQCPRGLHKGYVLSENGEPRGYFVLGRTDWEGRLLDIFVNSTDLRHWKQAYATATCKAAEDPETCRIRTIATTPLLREALLQNGYWEQSREPLMIHDPRNLLAPALPVSFQLFDGDGGY